MVVMGSGFRYFKCTTKINLFSASGSHIMGKSIKMKDSTVDAIAAIIIIALVVTTAVFWVSHQ
ncbi:hypothetical protein ACH42_02970 [Endozoicomonas sp. (ex Bugula neritina AB1)]|nr:hypothetical protein ACH42_02970 [Endozoicomonas sp. (ex Bugula neritina AB1)]